MNFGEVPFEYQININKGEDEKENVCSVLNDNIGLWLGYNSLEVGASPLQPSGELNMGAQHQENDAYEDPLDKNESYQGFEEEKHLMILYRLDQGVGTKIFDLTENENNGKLLREKVALKTADAGYVWENGELEPGNPMIFEDEWGKEAPPNWALKFTGKESIRLRGSKTLSKFLGHFTFQIWLNFEDTEKFINNEMDVVVSC